MSKEEQENMDSHIKEINRLINKVTAEVPEMTSTNYLSGGSGVASLTKGGSVSPGAKGGSVKMNKKKTKQELSGMCKECHGGTLIPKGYKMVRIKKERSDKNQSREPNDWVSFVRVVADKYALPYNKALAKASELRKKGVNISDL